MCFWNWSSGYYLTTDVLICNYYYWCCCCYDFWGSVPSVPILVVLLIESFYWCTVLYLDNTEYVILGVIFGFCVILIILSVDNLAVLLLLMIWPMWLLYMKFVSAISIVGVYINELKKLVSLLVVSFMPNLMLVLVFSITLSGLLLVVVASSYLVMSVTNVGLFVLMLILYSGWIMSYRILLLSLMPLPLFFAKISLPWYLVYLVILVGASIFV